MWYLQVKSAQTAGVVSSRHRVTIGHPTGPYIAGYSSHPFCVRTLLQLRAHRHCGLPTLQKLLSRMIREGVSVTDVSHNGGWVRMPSNLHYLIQARMVDGRTGDEASSQRMPRYVLRVQPDCRRVLLDNTRYIAVMHRPASQASSPLHCLKERTTGYARSFQPQA